MMRLKLSFIGLISIALLLVSSCSKPCVEVDVPYQEDEPYEDFEDQEIKLTYSSNGYTWDRIPGATLLGVKPKLEIDGEITNTSDHAGTFKVYIPVKTTLDEAFELRKEVYIPAGATRSFSFSKVLDDYVQAKPGKVYITAPYKTIQKKVTKYRSVTKYRKCNTCVEECGEKYEEESILGFWEIAVIIGGIAFLGWFFKNR